jgi:hypothetical protein
MILDPHYLIRIMPAEGKYTWRVDFIPSTAEGIFYGKKASSIGIEW